MEWSLITGVIVTILFLATYISLVFVSRTLCMMRIFVYTLSLILDCKIIHVHALPMIA